jgi:hypothetical protein
VADRELETSGMPLERLDYDTAQLMAEHPPIWRDRNKQVVFGINSPPGSIHGGQLTYSRWAAMPVPDVVDPVAARRLVEARDGFYDYAPSLGPGAVEWHVNFADPHLFVAYSGGLFAQDEMQVAEHPALGAVKEALASAGHRAVTIDAGEPTPALVTGVERRCRIVTDRDASAGRPDGLYGNAFSRASTEAVTRATTRIDPPTVTNIVAMSAPPGGYGRYRAETIEAVLVTAFTGFRAAVLESRRMVGPDVRVAVHTGYWGCGAFGGNRVLMALLQVLAGGMAGLDSLVFHVGAPGGRAPLEEALRRLRDELAVASPVRARDLIEQITALGFAWGVSDGN